MNDYQQDELNQLIKEYEEDDRAIRSERVMMKYYPKVFTMLVASLFECNIKKKCKDFINNPILPLSSNYHNIHELRYPVDDMYKKFRTNDSMFDASKFYDLFNGEEFKNRVQEIFGEIKQNKLDQTKNYKRLLFKLLTTDEKKYEDEYGKVSDLYDQYNNCNFETAEYEFLSLKKRRNDVAHNYIDGLSDTFNDIKKSYYLADIYVTALERTIVELTDS